MTSITRLSPITSVPLLTFLVSAWVAAGFFYSDLPNLMPTHWTVPGKADDFIAKPWGPFVLPLTMTLIWLCRPILRHLSFPSQRIERFPGAFDFRIMLTVGVLFVIWTLVVAQSVFWLRAVALPASIALVVAGSILATVPFHSVRGLGSASFLRQEAEWLRARRSFRAMFVTTGLAILAVVAFTG